MYDIDPVRGIESNNIKHEAQKQTHPYTDSLVKTGVTVDQEKEWTLQGDARTIEYQIMINK